MDPVIKPLVNYVCGENQKLVDSHLPQAWKSLLLGIDDAVMQWAKKHKTNDIKEVKRLRSEALVAFISTRGYMMVLGGSIQKFCIQEEVDSVFLTSYMNSYFSHRADKFIIDNPVANDVESEKTEQSSESEIATESDSNADKASSEKTEESS